MLKPHRTGADRALGVVSVCLAIAACALVAFEFFTPLIALALPGRRPSTFLVLLGGTLVIGSPVFAFAAIVSGHVARRLYPQQTVARVGLILGYSVLGLIGLVLAGGVITWLTIATIR